MMTQQTDTIKSPIVTYRLGLVSATILEDTTKDGQPCYRTVIVRDCQDRDGNWQTSSEFHFSDLLLVTNLAERATKRITELM